MEKTATRHIHFPRNITKLFKKTPMIISGKRFCSALIMAMPRTQHALEDFLIVNIKSCYTKI